MTKFYRVELPGVMVLWMSGTMVDKLDPVCRAISRAQFQLSSIIGQNKRTNIDPNNRQKIQTFAYPSREQRELYMIDIFHCEDKNVKTRDLNIQELYIAAGKDIPHYSVTDKACLLFRETVNTLLKKIE